MIVGQVAYRRNACDIRYATTVATAAPSRVAVVYTAQSVPEHMHMDTGGVGTEREEIDAPPRRRWFLIIPGFGLDRNHDAPASSPAPPADSILALAVRSDRPETLGTACVSRLRGMWASRFRTQALWLSQTLRAVSWKAGCCGCYPWPTVAVAGSIWSHGGPRDICKWGWATPIGRP